MRVMTTTPAVVIVLLALPAFAKNPTFGDGLPGLTAAQETQFEDGRDEFLDVQNIASGLGPVFNDNSCAACHTTPVVGGSSTRTETRFGRVTSSGFDPLVNLGGSLIQS